MLKIFDVCRRKHTLALETPPSPTSSVLDAVGKDPRRFDGIKDAAIRLQRTATRVINVAFDSFQRISNSLADVFCVNSVWERLSKTTVSSACIEVAPYFAAGLSMAIIDSYSTLETSRLDQYKMALGFLFLGYLMKDRITETSNVKSTIQKVTLASMAVWSFVTLHQIFYSWGYNFSSYALVPLCDEHYINDETHNNLSILAAIVSTAAVLPSCLIFLEKLIDRERQRVEAFKGQRTQSSKIAKISSGSTKEVSSMLILYDHFLSELKEPERLFQYLLVSLNVLRDTTPVDPDNPSLEKKKGISLVLNKTRNMWLLAIDSFIKAKNDYFYKSEEINSDFDANNQEFVVIRNGRVLSHVKRFQLEIGDLVSIDQVFEIHEEEGAISTRFKALLSGYLVQLGTETLKKVAVSFVELNGENTPVILTPSISAKRKTDCKALELHTAPKEGAILPGCELISFDNGNHDPKPDFLYLQIAAYNEIKISHKEKVPFSQRQIKQLKNSLIYTSLISSCLLALPLMNYQSVPLRFKKVIQFYGTEFVDKFAQVFSETQQIIPLVSEVLLEMVNGSLVKGINKKLDHKLSLNSALLCSDLFEFIRQNKLKILSDKTGTVTETTMNLRSVVCEAGKEENLIKAFATTFSDQKTEFEENEIRRFLEVEEDIFIEAQPSGAPGVYEKIISKDEDVTKFTSKKLGLFRDFGGQFSIMEETGKAPRLIFCGIPREEVFQDTTLFEKYKSYEAHEKENAHLREGSLPRDWCIAELELAPLNYREIQAALLDEATSIATLSEIFRRLSIGFEYLGVFQIDNPIKKDARNAIERWKKAGIDFYLITGDTLKAAKLIAEKLYGVESCHVIEAANIGLYDFDDLSSKTIVFTNTNDASLSLLDRLTKDKKNTPSIIFCQMKDIDKKRIADHEKERGHFIVASGDGSNDLLMFNSSHLAIASSANDGSFARGVEQASNLSDIQIKELMGQKQKSIYQLLDIDKGKESLFLKHFAAISNTQPKVITSLLGKTLKSMAIPRLVGLYTKEIAGQFGLFLSYDAAFLGLIYQICLLTKDTPLIAEGVETSLFPKAVLITTLGLASLQSLYTYNFHDRQIATLPMLIGNLGFSAICLKTFLSPPGFRPTLP